MFKWLGLALAIAALGGAGSAGAEPERIELAWMAGDWLAKTPESWTEERWSSPRGGVMLGTSLSGKGGAANGYEFLRLARGADGTLAYHASPGGAPAVAFRLVRSAANEAVFENPAHDFPQRIAYRRAGDVMTATISDISGGKAMSWRFERQ